MGLFRSIERCYEALCHACNGSGYDCFDDRHCDVCTGAGSIEVCPVGD